jgi:excinuclease UvrABC helicase subunit UvrB
LASLQRAGTGVQSPSAARFIAELEERMREAARKFEFEKAAQLRDRVKSLRIA